MTEYEFEHYGITVDDIDEIVLWLKNFGFNETRRTQKEDLNLELAILEHGKYRIELIKPGQGLLHTPLHTVGQQHLAFSTADVSRAYDELKDEVKFIPEFLDKGLYFCFPKEAYTDIIPIVPPGALVEIKQKR